MTGSTVTVLCLLQILAKELAGQLQVLENNAHPFYKPKLFVVSVKQYVAADPILLHTVLCTDNPPSHLHIVRTCILNPPSQFSRLGTGGSASQYMCVSAVFISALLI